MTGCWGYYEDMEGEWWDVCGTIDIGEDYMGTVVGDLNARRGQVVRTDIRNGAVIVTANVPLSTMFGYATDLRSKTQGRANYSMEPSHFVELPKSLQEKIIGNRG